MHILLIEDTTSKTGLDILLAGMTTSQQIVVIHNDTSAVEKQTLQEIIEKESSIEIKSYNSPKLVSFVPDIFEEKPNYLTTKKLPPNRSKRKKRK